MYKYFAGLAFSASILAFAPLAASASVVYSSNLATGALVSPGSVSTSFSTALAGPASIAFQIQGYASLDGNNYYRDNFSLFVNGIQSYVGTFDLGGGGSNLVTFKLPGSSSFNVTPVSTGSPTFGGGFADIVTPINLVSGLNILKFAYDSPGSPYAGPQGLGDEGWGINRVTVTSAVPEPATWAMMLIGFAGLAMMGGRRRQTLAI